MNKKGLDINSSLGCGHSELGVCPECGKTNLEVKEIEYEFPYGVGNDRANLCATVPARTCPDCGFTFLDHGAEEKCQEAICRHLGVMAPSQIRALRDLHGLSQSQFADVTKLGVATLSRWERGVVIQNQAYDNYLFLLGFPENLDMIRKRGTKEARDPATATDTTPKFRRLRVTPEMRRRQRQFDLHIRPKGEKVLCT